MGYRLWLTGNNKPQKKTILGGTEMTVHFKPTAGDIAIAQRLNRAITANYNVYGDIKRCANILLMFLEMHPTRSHLLTTEYKNTISKL